MITLLLCRHGETDYNAHRRYTGSSDVLLNENGFAQAERLARNPALQGCAVIVSSPLLRAVQTARILQKELGKSLHIVPEFAERSLGVYEGLTRQEAQTRYPELWNAQCTMHADLAPTGGETLSELAQRVGRGLSHLREHYCDQTILLVAHGAVAREINRVVLGLSFANSRDFFLGNGEVKKYLLP